MLPLSRAGRGSRATKTLNCSCGRRLAPLRNTCSRWWRRSSTACWVTSSRGAPPRVPALWSAHPKPPPRGCTDLRRINRYIVIPKDFIPNVRTFCVSDMDCTNASTNIVSRPTTLQWKVEGMSFPYIGKQCRCQ